MFTIQYGADDGTHRLQTFDGKRDKLIKHLATFERPIVEVYEQASPITKAVRKELILYPGGLSAAARNFISSRR